MAAAGWGLLAWEDPLAATGPASPFWAEASMLEAEPVGRGAPGLLLGAGDGFDPGDGLMLRLGSQRDAADEH